MRTGGKETVYQLLAWEVMHAPRSISTLSSEPSELWDLNLLHVYVTDDDNSCCGSQGYGYGLCSIRGQWDSFLMLCSVSSCLSLLLYTHCFFMFLQAVFTERSWWNAYLQDLRLAVSAGSRSDVCDQCRWYWWCQRLNESNESSSFSTVDAHLLLSLHCVHKKEPFSLFLSKWDNGFYVYMFLCMKAD